MHSNDSLKPGEKIARMPNGIESALSAGSRALGDLFVVEHALRTVASEDNPLDDEMRQVVLCHAIDLMHERLETIDETLDSLDDHLAGHLTEQSDRH